MVSKPYRSRSLIFNHNNPTSPTSAGHHIGRSFFSPSSSSSPPAVNTPSPDLDTDPFRSSIDSIPYDGIGDTSTTSLVRATAKTPKITLASPSTTSFQFLDHPPGPRNLDGLDPTAAKRISRSILKNKAREIRSVPLSPRRSSTVDPVREARRTVSSSDLRTERQSIHPLSMRTLRRQPSLIDLHTHRTKADNVSQPVAPHGPQMVPLASRKSSDFSNICHPKRQEQAWKNIMGRRESEAWRHLVDSRDRDQVPTMIEDMISPRTRSFPAAGDDESAPVPPRPVRQSSHPFLSSFDPVPRSHPQAELPSGYPTARRPTGRSSVTDMQIPIQHSRASSPEFADHVDFSSRYASPTYTYSNLDLSFSISSGMSRSGTVGSRLDSAPMSVAMEREVQQPFPGGLERGKLEARADALRRLSGFGGPQHDLEDDARIQMLRRAASFKKDSKRERPRPRAYSLSAKSIRGSVISSPIPIDVPLPDRRRTVERSRGLLLDDLTIDLGGRYVDRAITPVSVSTDTSLYPASSDSSRVPSRSYITGKPLQQDFNRSEVSLLAPSSVGLGFSPIGTPVSLPESLQAEAIDLTGNYGDAKDDEVRVGRDFRRSLSRPRIKLDSPPPPVPALPDRGDPDCSLDSNGKPRRSLLLAQNTFYIPPIVGPPSLRSSKSLSNLRPSQPSTPTVPIPPTVHPKPTYQKRRTGAFGICSPTDAIDPLPINANDGVSPMSLPGLERKKSSPFINASSSIRMVFSKNPIARTLTKTFDRERPDESNGKEWREGLLKEAVTVSLGGSVSQRPSRRPDNPKSRSAIPKELLEAPMIVPEEARAGSIPMYDEMGPDDAGRLPQEDNVSVYSLHGTLNQSTRGPSRADKRRSRASTVTAAVRSESTRHPASNAMPTLFFETEEHSYHTSTAVEHANTTPVGTLHRRPTPYYSEPPPGPATHTLQRKPTPYYDRTVTRHPDATSSGASTRSFRSLGLRLRHRPSRPALAPPISSASPLITPRPILDALSTRERLSTQSTDGDKNRKILEWRSEVDENGELAKLEERMIKHVEREKETLRDMGRRTPTATIL